MLFENDSQKALDVIGFLVHAACAMNGLSRFRTWFPLALLFFLKQPILADAADRATIEMLRETISGLVDLQSQASKEAREWEARRDSMLELIEIHQREIALIDEELEKSGRSAPGHAEAVSEAKVEIARLKEARGNMLGVIERVRPRVLQLAGRFPLPLVKEINAEMALLGSWKSGQEPREALQAVLGVLSKASQFNRRVSRSKESIDGREVDVIYLGLAVGYYADRGGSAGVGRAGEAGWEWSADPALNRQVLRAFDILEQKQPPSRIDLPLMIE